MERTDIVKGDKVDLNYKPDAQISYLQIEFINQVEDLKVFEEGSYDNWTNTEDKDDKLEIFLKNIKDGNIKRAMISAEATGDADFLLFECNNGYATVVYEDMGMPFPTTYALYMDKVVHDDKILKEKLQNKSLLKLYDCDEVENNIIIRMPNILATQDFSMLADVVEHFFKTLKLDYKNYWCDLRGLLMHYDII